MKFSNIYTAALSIRMQPNCFLEAKKCPVANTYFIIHDALHAWLDVPPAGLDNERIIDLAEHVLGGIDTVYTTEELEEMSARLEAIIPAEDLVSIKHFHTVTLPAAWD